MFGVIVYAAKVGAYPYTSFGVFTKAVHRIVGKRIGVEEFFPEVGGTTGVDIQDEDA